LRNTVLYGDCRQTLQQIAQSGDKARMCVTSPPYYGLRDYGKEDDQIGLEESPEEFIDQLVEVFRGVRDCLTDDGTLWVNIGDSYYNYRGGKGQALPKQSVATTNQDLPQGKNPRRGNKLKGYKEKDLIGIPWMLAFALRKDGWYLRQDIIWSKPNPMPESVRDRCTKSHEYIFLLSKSQNYYFDVNSIKVPTVDGNQLKRRKSVWEVKTKPYKGAHFAVYPSELIIPTILAGSEEGDIILDPFMGSGTTAAVAKSLKRDYLGCELHDDYDALIHKRVSEVSETVTVDKSTLLDLLK
jgi:DNA modification methylase|tara:strand:- start:43 stop:933 length:891 start_codon:yes stop_codon:yes gene_type:complete